MTHSQIVAKLEEIRPGCQWSLSGDTYEGLVWLDTNQPKPTPEELGF